MAKKIGLIAGGGLLPALIIEALQKESVPFFVVTFKGQPKPQCQIPEEHHKEVNLGAVGKVLKLFQKNNVTDMVMAGFLSKPSLFDVRPDFAGLKILASLTHKHDDALLSAISGFFGKHGIGNVGAHELVPEILAHEGVYGKVQPTESQKSDVELGLKAALTLGELDIGQSVVVKNGVVLGVEGAEGTDALIERCAGLRGKKNSGGLLVKCIKPHQNKNIDMPTIGVETIEKLKKYHYEGLAISAGGALVLGVAEVIEAADNAGIFIVGSKGENNHTSKRHKKGG